MQPDEVSSDEILVANLSMNTRLNFVCLSIIVRQKFRWRIISQKNNIESQYLASIPKMSPALLVIIV